MWVSNPIFQPPRGRLFAAVIGRSPLITFPVIGIDCVYLLVARLPGLSSSLSARQRRGSRSRQLPRSSFAVGISVVESERCRVRVMHLEDRHGESRLSLCVLCLIVFFLPSQRHGFKLPCRLNVVVYVSAFTVQLALLF